MVRQRFEDLQVQVREGATPFAAVHVDQTDRLLLGAQRHAGESLDAKLDDASPAAEIGVRRRVGGHDRAALPQRALDCAEAAVELFRHQGRGRGAGHDFRAKTPVRRVEKEDPALGSGQLQHRADEPREKRLRFRVGVEDPARLGESLQPSVPLGTEVLELRLGNALEAAQEAAEADPVLIVERRFRDAHRPDKCPILAVAVRQKPFLTPGAQQGVSRRNPRVVQNDRVTGIPPHRVFLPLAQYEVSRGPLAWEKGQLGRHGAGSLRQ